MGSLRYLPVGWLVGTTAVAAGRPVEATKGPRITLCLTITICSPSSCHHRRRRRRFRFRWAGWTSERMWRQSTNDDYVTTTIIAERHIAFPNVWYSPLESHQEAIINETVSHFRVHVFRKRWMLRSFGTDKSTLPISSSKKTRFYGGIKLTFSYSSLRHFSWQVQ